MQEGSGKGVAGKDVVGGDAIATNDGNRSTEDGKRKFGDMRNKCHRCLEPGYRFFDCTAHVMPAATKSHNGSGEVIGCLAIRYSW